MDGVALRCPVGEEAPAHGSQQTASLVVDHGVDLVGGSHVVAGVEPLGVHPGDAKGSRVIVEGLGEHIAPAHGVRTLPAGR